MSCIGENKNKFPVELISKLLTRLLDSRLNQLEKKAEEEMGKIESASKNTNVMINELQVKHLQQNLTQQFCPRDPIKPQHLIEFVIRKLKIPKIIVLKI